MIVRSGDRKTIGNKAFDLLRCRLLGIPVPDFFVITGDCNRNDPVLNVTLENILVRLGGVVAVRSSSTAEDTGTSSAAGKYKTVLNVDSSRALTAAVKCVWASAECDHMAVIIQRQLRPDISGVLFTRNPANGKHETVIEYVEGLGDKLVSGRIKPVRADRVDIKNRFGGLISHARKLEKCFGYPLDIEWASSLGRFYILQARPVTALPPEPPGTCRTYSRVQAEQFYSGPVTPLFYSFFNLLHSKYYLRETFDDLGWDLKIENGLVRHKSHLYADTALAEFVITHLPVKGTGALLDEVLPEDLKAELGTRKKRTDLKAVIGLLKFITANPCLWPWNLDRHFRNTVAPQIIADMEDLTDFESMSTAELNGAYDRIMAAAVSHVRISKWGLALYLPLFLGAATGLLKKRGFGIDELSPLLAGLPENKTFAASLELKRLGKIIKEQPEAVSIFKQERGNYQDYKQKLMMSPAGELIIDYFESILRRYGHRRLSRDLRKPSWSDDPDIPFSILKKMVVEKVFVVDDAKTFSDTRRPEPGLRFARELTLGGRIKFMLLSKYFIRYTAFRENQRFFLDMIISKMRKLLLEISRRMVGDGVLEQTDDVFFIDLDDILDYLNGTLERGLIKKSRFNRITFENETEPPGKFLRNGVDFDSVTFSDDKAKTRIKGRKKVLLGQGISPGFFSGKARVVPYIDSNVSINQNDIIVTKYIDPGQTHVFLLAGALIIEVGGMLSHGAILAREFNLPTVANVKNVTGRISDGQIISVNGTKGEIII